MLEQFKAFIFDMDGTLVDSGQLHEQAWSHTLRYFGLPLDRQYMRSLAGVPTQETVASVMKRFGCSMSGTIEDVECYKAEYVTKHLAHFVKPTQLIDLVKQYQGRVPMSVGTGAGTSEAEQVLKVCGLYDLVDHVVGCDRVVSPKPAPDTFLLCAKLMSVSPADCIVFEDAKLGIEAAKCAGMAVLDVLEAFSIKNDYFL